MSRKSEFQQTNPNPAKAFLEWKSDDKCFAFYDKEKAKNVQVKLPFKFLILKEMHTVKGWHDQSESGIWSNEVKFIGTEPITVKAFKGGEIASGLYADIKSKIKDAGAVYYKSLYIMTPKGELLNVSIKGSAVAAWGEFTKKTRSRLFDEWITVAEAEDKKKGSKTYSVPVFKFAKSLSAEEGDKADEAYKILQDYMKKYEGNGEAPAPPADVKNMRVNDAEIVEPELDGVTVDDLDF